MSYQLNNPELTPGDHNQMETFSLGSLEVGDEIVRDLDGLGIHGTVEDFDWDTEQPELMTIKTNRGAWMAPEDVLAEVNTH